MLDRQQIPHRIARRYSVRFWAIGLFERHKVPTTSLMLITISLCAKQLLVEYGSHPRDACI